MTDYNRSNSGRFAESLKKYDPIEADEDDGSTHETNNIQDEKLKEYVKHLLAEKLTINKEDCPYAYKYICEEIGRVQQQLVKGPPRDTRYIDMYNERPVKVAVKVLLPVKEFPRFNFVGKLLGPKGSTLKQLQENSRCFMNICGRGSMRDREKEEELRRSLEPKYAHLSDDLHVEISTIASPTEAHARISSALAEVGKYLVPEYDIPDQEEHSPIPNKSIFGKVSSFPNSQGNDISRGREERLHQSASRQPSHHPITSKSSVMSILNRARMSMQESHNVQTRRRPMTEPHYNQYNNTEYNSYGNRDDALFKRRKI